MTRKTKFLGFVMLAQFGCVGLGLWMHYRFTLASVAEDAEQRSWFAIADVGGELAERIRQLPQPSRLGDTEATEQLRALVKATQLAVRFNVTFVDSSQRVILPLSASEQTPRAKLRTAQKLTWSFLPPDYLRIDGATAIVLDLSGGAHRGLLYRFATHDYALIVHEPQNSDNQLALSMARTIPAVSVMSFLWTCGLLAVTVTMILSRFHNDVERKASDAEALSLRRIDSLVRTRDAVIFGLAKLADSRDPETGSHLDRISTYSMELSGALRSHPAYQDRVTNTFVRLIGISSVLHDIGKVGIEDQILRKPGLLTEVERDRMQLHAGIGGECILGIERRLGSSNFLQMAREIAFAHHERWDGSGYPNGLREEQIPLAARIVAIVDVYDALSSKRVYKEAYPHDRCVEIIREGSGTKFDPKLVDVWLGIGNRFKEIAWRYSDAPSARGSPPGEISVQSPDTVELKTTKNTEPQAAASEA